MEILTYWSVVSIHEKYNLFDEQVKVSKFRIHTALLKMDRIKLYYFVLSLSFQLLFANVISQKKKKKNTRSFYIVISRNKAYFDDQSNDVTSFLYLSPLYFTYLVLRVILITFI